MIIRRVLLLTGLLLSCANIGFAGECGSSGNTFWQYSLPDLTGKVAVDRTNIYCASGTVVTGLKKLPDAFPATNFFSRNFSPVSPGRPLPIEDENGTSGLIVCGSDGYVYKLSPSTGVTLWSRSLRRPTCSTDSIVADPVVQKRYLSDTNFQSAMTSDLVIVGTALGCSTTTANRICAIRADTGAIAWAHNASGSYQYDRIMGLTVDYERNSVYATADSPVSPAQHSVIALNTLNGARRWGRALGAVVTEPVLANSGLYVVTREKVLHKLDPESGQTIWQATVGPGFICTISPVVDAAINRVYVVTGGTVTALLDTCISGVPLWSNPLGGNNVASPPTIQPFGHKIYVGSGDGKVYQLNHETGQSESYAAIGSSPGSIAEAVTTLSPTWTGLPGAGGLRLIAAGGGMMKFICIPWFADGVNKARIASVPGCFESGAPSGGLVLHGDLGRMTNYVGSSFSRTLLVANTTCFPFQCAAVYGLFSTNLTVQLLTSTNATVDWDTNSFAAWPSNGIPFQASLTMSSLVPGTYLSTVTISNSGNLHGTWTLTNVVVGTTISVADLAAPEGNSGVTSFDFSVKLVAPVSVPVSVAYTTSNGTATAGIEFIATNGVLTFAAGETNKFVRVGVLADAVPGPNRNFFVTLSDPTNAILAQSLATGTILNDDSQQAPVVNAPVADQAGIYGYGFSYTFATNTFVDPNGDPLTYMADGLPPGVTLHGPSRTISGTPSQTGTFTVTLYADDSIFTANDTFNIVIGKAPLIASANAVSRTYGSTNPPLTIGYSGFVLGENSAVLDVLPSPGCLADPNSPVGPHTISLSGGTDDHYELTLQEGWLTVVPAPLVVTIDSTNRPYAQPNPAVTGSITGIVNGDDISAAYGTLADLSSWPGGYAIIAELLDPATRLGNYSVIVNNGTLTVDCVNSLEVTSAADSGLGSLRDSVQALCPAGVITFNVTNVIALTNGQITLDKNLSLVGPGATNLTILAATGERVFQILSNAQVMISGVILDGNIMADTQDFMEGGYYYPGATVELGGCLWNQGNLSLVECVIANGVASQGGGVANEGTLTAERCLFSGSLSFADGGGVFNAEFGVMNLTNCTISANRAYDFGGAGIGNRGNLCAVNCTIAFNIKSQSGEYHFAGGLLHLSGSLQLWNSIISDNIGRHWHPELGAYVSNWDLDGAPNSGDYNLIQHGHAGVPGAHSISGVSAILLPLADNGGPTRTHALSPASSAMNAGNSDGAPMVDQRGFLRPGGSGNDLGAYEAEANLAPIVLNPIPDQTNTYGGAFEFTFAANTFSDPNAGQALTYTALELPPGIDFDGLTRTFSGMPTEVGSNWVTVVATDDGNPVLSTNTSFAIVISKATLAVDVTSKTNLYGDYIFVSPFVDLSYSGFQFFDSIFDLDVFPDVTTTATNGAPVGVYPITASGGLDDKYDFVFNDGTLTIQPADLVVVVDNHCRPLGQTNPPLTASLLGIQFGDNITAQLNTIATTNSPLGDYPITVALNDPDGKLTNYVVTTINGMLSVVDFSVDYGIVRSFGFTNLMGSAPSARVIEGSDGVLYGTTPDRIYRVNRDGSGYVVLREGGSTAPLLEGSDGVLYGTAETVAGGGQGIVFKLNRDGTGYSVLHNFAGGAEDGATPSAAVIEGTNGMLYGNTQFGGINDRGTLFKLNKDGTGYTNFHHFSTFGRYPTTALIQATDGKLYGATSIGGPSFGGTVFTINEDGTDFTVLRDFGLVDGFSPMAPQDVIEGSDGVLYATTQLDGTAGFGTVFKINKDGSGYAVLHEFASTSDGILPRGGLIEASDGMIYGTTQWGDSTASGAFFSGAGAVFRLNKDGSGYALVLDVGPVTPGMAGPVGVVEGTDLKLYGVCASGGAAQWGTIFTANRNGTDAAVLWNFNNTGGDGSKPLAALIEGRDGCLYGVSSEGGSAGKGTIYKVNKDGSGQTILHNFTGSGGDGMNPNAQLLQASDDWLYGIAPSGIGGAGDILFRVQTNGANYTILHHFSFPDYQSAAPVIEGTDGMLYGTFSLGGAFFGGTAFKIGRDGSGFTVLRSFNGSDGNTPQGLIQGSDGLLYGANYGGGNFSAGTLYKMDTNGGNFTVVHEFNSGDDTFNPTGRLHRDGVGVLFGAAAYGGEIGYGTVYRVNSDGSGFQILHGFRGTAADGAYPSGGLVESAAGMLYGTTTGDEFSGLTSTVFQLSKTGSNYCVLHVFDSGPGDSRYARSGLVHASDGRFYGTAKLGGDSGLGTVYRFGLEPLELNSRPIVLNPIPDQTNSYGGVFSFTFVTNSFDDADSGQTLSYAASNLPPGIVFDGPTRTFSGICSNAGTFAVTVTARDNGSPLLDTNDVFNIVLNKAPLLATAADKTRGYGAPNPLLTVSYTGFVLGDTAAVLGQPPLIGTGAGPGSPVGTYPITLTGGSDDNYELTLTNGTLTITPASLTVTAANTNRPYGQANPPLTGALVGLTNSDPITVSFVTEATPTSLPGTYTIAPSWSDPNNRLTNYIITTTFGTLTVDCLALVTVTNNADAGEGTLRDALLTVCPGGTINFALTGTITLTSDHLQPSHSVSIVGPGATNLTLSGGTTWRLFNVTTGALNISALTLAQGNDSADFLVGAAIRNNAQLTVTECVFSNNVSEAAGGAIFNRPAGILVVDRCLFVNNRALGAFQGGGVGGAIANQGSLFVTNSTFSGNRAGFSAAAIRSTGGLIIESSTFTANTASECTDCEGIASIVAHVGTNAVIHNSIFGGNTNVLGVFRDLTGAMDDSDFNLVEFASGYVGTGTNDLLGVSPLLAPLADNGGPTWTHLPLAGSPVIDAGDPASMPTLDQRVLMRPQNGRMDIGAVETVPAILPPTLFILHDGLGGVTVSWTPATPGFVLQTNLNLNPFTWGEASSGSTNPAVFPAISPAAFYRLFRP